MKRLYLMLAIVIFITSLVVLHLWKNGEINQDFEDEFIIQSEIYEQVKPKDITTIPNEGTSVQHDTQTEYDTTIQNMDYLAECKKINLDTIAWLYIPNTNIDFPVMQSQDNEYYLNHSLEKKSSSYGVPFLDYRCSKDFSDFNSIIYGHNIRGQKMFADLLNFQNQEYFNTHPTGYLTTENFQYKIDFIACLILKNDGFAYNTIFLNDNEKNIFIDEIKSQAICYKNLTVDDISNIRLVGLSTCSYEFTDARTILIGVINA